jgi:hypothetical protein
MQQYELKIYRAEHVAALTAIGGYLSDFAAIRAARALCRDGQGAEVWRGDVCIFAEPPGTKLHRQSGQPAA